MKKMEIPFSNFQPNTVISSAQLNDNFYEIQYKFNLLFDNGIVNIEANLKELEKKVSVNTQDIFDLRSNLNEFQQTTNTTISQLQISFNDMKEDHDELLKEFDTLKTTTNARLNDLTNKVNNLIIQKADAFSFEGSNLILMGNGAEIDRIDLAQLLNVPSSNPPFKVFDVKESDWVFNTSEDLYILNLTHNLKTSDLLVMESSGGYNNFVSYQTIGDSGIIIHNDEPINVRVVICVINNHWENPDGEIDPAKLIDDNSILKVKTWSSFKINEELQKLVDLINEINTGILPADWNTITNKPSTFPPSTHNHSGDTLLPSNIGTISSNVTNGYFNKLFLNGTELTPGGSGGEVTYDAVNSVITGREINSSIVNAKDFNLSLRGGQIKIRPKNLTGGNLAGVDFSGTGTNVDLTPSDVTFNVGTNANRVSSVHTSKLFVDGTEITSGGPGGEVTYESVNGAITGKTINPQSVFSKTSGLNLLVQDDSIGQGFSLYKGANSTALLPFPANGKIDIGENISRINEGHFEKLYVGGTEVVPGSGGTAPTYDQINNTIKGREINVSTVRALNTSSSETSLNLEGRNSVNIKIKSDTDRTLAFTNTNGTLNVTSSYTNLGSSTNRFLSGHFDKLFLNGTEIIGGGSGGAPTYEQVNSVIYGKTINSNHIDAQFQSSPSDLKLSGSRITLHPSAGMNTPNYLNVTGYDTKVIVYPSATGKADLGSSQNVFGAGYFNNLYVNGQEVKPGGGTVDYDSVNNAIKGKEINPGKVVSTGGLHLKGETNLALLTSDDTGLYLQYDSGKNILAPYAGGNVEIGTSGNQINNGYFKDLNVNGQNIGVEFKTTKTGLINAINELGGLL